jgi:hypothetical protein
VTALREIAAGKVKFSRAPWDTVREYIAEQKASDVTRHGS